LTIQSWNIISKSLIATSMPQSTETVSESYRLMSVNWLERNFY
jgi:hypothetical protein